MGTTTRKWDKSWMIIADDGTSTRFTDYSVMSFNVAKNGRTELNHWRFILPMLVVNAAIFVAMFALWKKESRAMKRRRN